MADGHIRIDIVGDDKDLQKKLKEIERLEKQKRKIEYKIKIAYEEVGTADDKLLKAQDILATFKADHENILKLKQQYIQKGWGVGFADEMTKKDMDIITGKIQEQQQEVNKLESAWKKKVATYDHEKEELDIINGKIKMLNTEADKVQLTNMNKSMTDINTNLKQVGGGIKGVIKKVAKWGLALFGIRSAYMGIRRLMSTLSQYNEQLKTDISYIGFSIAKVFEPVILRIVELVYKALQFINSIVGALFGVNLFAKATADAFQRGNAGIGGMVDNARKLKRELAGFDEMNRLSEGLDNTGGGGGIGGALAPSVDLSETKGAFDKVRQWWEELKNDLDPEIKEGWEKVKQGGKDTAEGLAEAWGGTSKVIRGLLTGDVDLAVEGFRETGEGLSDSLDGMLLSAEGFGEMFKGIFKTLWESIKKMAKEDWEGLKVLFLYYAAKSTMAVLDFGKKAYYGFKDWWGRTKENLKTWWNETVGDFKQIFSGITQFVAGVFTGDWNKAWTGIKNIFQGVWNLIKRGLQNAINGMIDLINVFTQGLNKLNITNYIPGGKPLGNIPKIQHVKLAKGGILNKPGTGVNVGGAIAGEAGREFYTPLNNEQVLAEVGSAIGKHIKVYTTSITQLNGRTLAKEMKVTENEENFAYNGGFR